MSSLTVFHSVRISSGSAWPAYSVSISWTRAAELGQLRFVFFDGPSSHGLLVSFRRVP
jgi:hypothetical protein